MAIFIKVFGAALKNVWFKYTNFVFELSSQGGLLKTFWKVNVF